MPIAVSEEHEHLAQVVRAWLGVRCPTNAGRAALDTDPAELPLLWGQIAAQGWLGLHLPERFGGQGFGVSELAVVLGELGRALVPGPVLSTVLTSAIVAASGTDSLCDAVLSGLADGSMPAGVSFGRDRLVVTPGADQGQRFVSGTLRTVLGAPSALAILAPITDGGWCLLDLTDPATKAGTHVRALDPVDSTRCIGYVVVDNVDIPADNILDEVTDDMVHVTAAILAAAESAGAARWCLETASDYAKVREQFGRPIGQFQGVKHKLADMLVATEQAEAAAWDAARALDRLDATSERQHDEVDLARSLAAFVSFRSFAACAKSCVQLLGGIGFTWEHDAHLYLKRSMSTCALLGGPDEHATHLSRLALKGTRRHLSADLPARAVDIRNELTPVIAALRELEGETRTEYLVDHGWAFSHWPVPWGRNADPLEQIVLGEELAAAGIARPSIGVGAWALPTLIAHGTEEQQQRWIRETLLGRITWCQLFSEPGAGSDLAALSTRGEKVDGGWLLTGQKLWTSHAHEAGWGICLARSDAKVAKHKGITYFIVDMASPGIDIRPLRDLTGRAEFNEVFLDSVFVPDSAVVGAPGDGWRIARTTLANERVSMSSGSGFGTGVEEVLTSLSQLGADMTPCQGLRAGELLAESQSLTLMGHRATLRALRGLDPGAGASVGKLLGAEHEQRVQEFGLSLAGAAGSFRSGEAESWVLGSLVTRCLTIAGGTSEVQRNLIAERLLGQPRDPEPPPSPSPR
jgi:alkylation response protein AidB-like acyl-CoA dehydrogenase